MKRMRRAKTSLEMKLQRSRRRATGVAVVTRLHDSQLSLGSLTLSRLGLVSLTPNLLDPCLMCLWILMG